MKREGIINHIKTRIHNDGGRFPVNKYQFRSLLSTPQHATAQQSVRELGFLNISHIDVENPPR